MKKLLTLMLALMLVISSGSMVMAEAKDYDQSWAKEEISYMIEKNVLEGYEDGTFKPENDMTKAEFYTVVNQLFGFEETAEVEFEDVNSDNWFYGHIEKGLKAGYIVPATNLNPNAKITRGEVARIISFIYEVEENKDEAMKFEDHSEIPTELLGAIGGLKKMELIAGYPDGTFKAAGEITRAEVVKMFYNASGEIINQAGEVSEDAEGNVLVNTGDVVLKDMTIEGNLYLTEGIGEGDVTLENVTVNGEMFIKGGGENSIVIRNSNINKMSVNKSKATKIRVVLENTKVNQVKASNNVKLELSKKSEVKSVELNDQVELDMEKDTKIDSLKTQSEDITIKSEGKIDKLETKKDIKVNDEVVKADTTSKVAEGKTTTQATTPSKPAGTTTDTTTSSGGSSWGSGGGGGGGSSSSLSTVGRAERDLKNLQTKKDNRLLELAKEAKAELAKATTNDEITALVSKYEAIITREKSETDAEVKVIIDNLRDRNYETEANRLNLEYINTRNSAEATYRTLAEAAINQKREDLGKRN